MARKNQSLKPWHWLLAALAGLGLSTLPFLRYVHMGSPAGAHADHAARHGGRLQMVGNHHLELLRQRGRAMIYVSDAFRQPVEPASGWITHDEAPRQPLRWDGQRMWAEDIPQALQLTIELILQDGTRLRWRFDPSDQS
ncbi:MAG: hypothetical protein JRH01_16550 [Deltaproteobacteria bacterium]|nr:hypothetical protein [Deltaproteobacteria bacterium]